MAKFKYLNVNPRGVRESDCVCRAITLISELPYDEVKEKLTLVGKLYQCPSLCVACYRHLIENILGYKPISGEGMYPGEFADIHFKGKYLLRMNGHILACIDGTIYDIFDSRFSGMITNAWKVE